MPTPSYHVRCLTYEEIAQDVFVFTLEKPEGFTFQAGQFVLFDIPLLTNASDIQTRAYSIASAPHEKDLLFVLKLKEGGRASAWVKHMLKVGTEVRMQGPFGRFILNTADSSPIVFLCTSTGNAPFRSQILNALTWQNVPHMDMLFGVRSEEDLFWVGEFEAIAKEHSQFHFHVALTKPSPTWKGYQGRVQQVLPLIVPKLQEKRLYVCGNPDMAKEIKALALGEWNIPKEQLHVEGFI